MISKTVLYLIVLILGFILGSITMTFDIKNQYNLHSNNNIIFIWNDTEASIPQDGELIQVQYTIEDTVYIGLPKY